MNLIFLERDYDDAQHIEMRLWCNRNTVGYFRCGSAAWQCPTVRLEEEPWAFERQEDATLFSLRWA